MDAIARAWLEFAKSEKTRRMEDNKHILAFCASEDVEVGMLVRIDPDAGIEGLVRPVTEDTLHEPFLGPVVFAYKGVAIVKIEGWYLSGEVKFP